MLRECKSRLYLLLKISSKNCLIELEKDFWGNYVSGSSLIVNAPFKIIIGYILSDSKMIGVVIPSILLINNVELIDVVKFTNKIFAT